jgi:predicted nucleic acid-binding protein
VGLGRVNAAVVNTGPLLHLAEIDGLTLLQVFDLLHIPDAVWAEAMRQGRLAHAEVERLGNVQRATVLQAEVTQFIREHRLEDLHLGECQCLYLCWHTSVSTFLTDDLDAREAAKGLNLTPVGSLGIVVRAYRQQRLSWLTPSATLLISMR